MTDLRAGTPVEMDPEWGPRFGPSTVVAVEYDGVPVESVVVEQVDPELIVVDLANGHWAYGYQLAPTTTGGTP